jgi:hypothetical protein
VASDRLGFAAGQAYGQWGRHAEIFVGEDPNNKQAYTMVISG